MTPLVSVLMSVYNGEKTVARAIESIIDQTYERMEFIIVNNGSTDETAREIAKATSKSYRIPFLVITHSGKWTLSNSLNEGLKACKGKYIVRQDADDYSWPHRIETQVRHMESNPSVGASGSDYKEVDPEGREVPRKMNPHNSSDVLEALKKYNPIAHPTAIIRKSILDEHKIEYDPKFKVAQDYDLWSRISNHSELTNLPLRLVTRTFKADPEKINQQERESIEIRQRMNQPFMFWFNSLGIKQHIPVTIRERLRKLRGG